MNQLSVTDRSRRFRFLVWLQIFLQVLFPLVSAMPHGALAQSPPDSASVSSPFSVDRSKPSADASLPYAGTLGSVASSLSSGGTSGVADSAKSAATGYASSTAQQWLSQFGTARVQLNVDDSGNWDDSAVDFLAPLYDNKKAVLFTQLGLRAPDGRTTGNVGMGVRTFYTENWMFGGNVFFDDDFTGKNRRVGFGAEAWTNYLKLSANTYVGTTEWHSSRDFDDYNEKPADGYDVRAEGYLPAYPQLGAKLIYEQYYGDKVALFDTDHLQSNPSAVTTGISYTPVPLVQLAVNYKRGQDSMDDTQFQANFRYDFGHDWRYQVDPENVRAERSLAGSRYDLVERNNQIILQYKKKPDEGVSKLNLQVITDNSPADGFTPNTLQVLATNSSNEPVRNAAIAWSASGEAKLSAPAAVTNAEGIAVVNLTNTSAATVQVSAKSGNVTAMQDSHFNTVMVSHLILALEKDGSVADGVTPNSAIATVTDINNRPIANSKIAWSVTTPAKLKNTETTTDANGQARTQYVSTQAGAVTIKASAGDLNATQQGTFVSNAANAQITDFTITTNNSPADGATPNKALVTVKDQNGNPANGVNVTVSADKNTVAFAALKSARASSAAQTDANGQLVISFTDTVVETATLTAKLDNNSTKTANAQFTANSATAQLQDLTLTKDSSYADGVTANTAEVTVKDANGNPVSAVDVIWSADKSSVKFSSSATDSTGKATVSFTDTIAETLTLKAQLANGNNLTVQSHFVANAGTATLQNLKVTKDGSAADGSDANTAEVYVKDATGNPIVGEDVVWSSDKTDVAFTPGGKTDSTGKTTVSYTSTVAQNLQLTAKLSNGQSASASSLFVPDTASEKISAFTVTSGAIANGTATNTATVTVVDAQNNRVPNADISWSVDGTAKLASATGKTGPDGQLSVTFTDLKAETVNVKVQLSSGTSETHSSTFVADATTAKIGDYTVTTGAVANGIATNSGSVTVVDANGNPLNGVNVGWTVTGTAQLASQTGTTGSDGIATVNLTNVTAQEVTLTVTVGSESQGLPTRFVADAGTAVIQTLTLDTTGSLANGSASNKVTATVVDGQGNLLADQAITWTADKSTVQLSPSGNTGSNGKASVSFTDTVAETVILKAQLANGDNKTQSSQFIANESTAVITDMVVSPDNSRADSVQANIVTVTVKDGTGNLLPNQNVQWTASRGAVVLTPSGATDTSGNASVSMTDTQGGPVDITAKLDNGSSMVRTSTFLSLNVVSLQQDITSQKANGTDVITFTATVKDSSGAVVSDTAVNFSTTGSATLSASSVQTDSSGQAIVTLKDEFGEDVTVKATSAINAADTGQSKSATFVAAKITAVIAGGHTFAPDIGFPQTGFYSAEFQLVVDGDAANASNYTWTYNQEASDWIRIFSPGVVSIRSTPPDPNSTVTITATPTGGGQPLTYTFTINHWFVSEAQASADPAEGDATCQSRGRETPSYADLSNGAPSSNGTRALGTLLGEWGDPRQYPSWSSSGNVQGSWAKETATTGTGQRIYVLWNSSFVDEQVLTAPFNVVNVVCKAY
ncbi:Ig-like domain-containing protein [Citrobacter enshiensis]|uniref:Ig-like domain-containing protein n=1 Tax=Citrobacter enshiensis TaxID=2971264 RepID=UPI0023E85AD3|nr:Ig-like domain-containing protein [Citrobacter enshiensis]WET41433.1 Ig-like domain-containing protein [Citrobacter enshiensis]